MVATASVSSASKGASAKRARPTAADIAARDAQIEDLRRQLAANPPAAAAPAAVDGQASPFPLIDLDDAAEPEPLKRVPLFKADGKEYTMVANPPPQWGFEALALAGDAGGADVAVGGAAARSQIFILRAMLGDDGLRALRTCKSITPEKLAQVLAICSQTVYGSLESPKAS